MELINIRNLYGRRRYLLHCDSLAHEVSSIKRSYSGICLLGRLHRDEPETARLTRVRVIHNLSFLDLCNSDEVKRAYRIVQAGGTYPANFGKGLLEVPRIDAVAQARHMQVVSGIVAAALASRQ